MLVKNIMTKDPITIKPELSVLEAEKVLSINKIGRLIVVDNDNNVIGILTDGDLMVEHDLNEKVEKFMSKSLIKIGEDSTIQMAATVLSENRIGGLPVFNKGNKLTGIVTSEDIVSCYAKSDDELELSRKNITPESSAVYLAMTRTREYENYWLEKIKTYGYKGAITQTGANAEKLPIKLRESTTVAAIARGVISENSREKTAISNAVKDAYSQLSLVNPGLGGGFKIAVIRGEDHVSVAIFGKFGHALVDGPEQITIGTSVI